MDGNRIRAANLMREGRYREAAPLLVKACSEAKADRQCWVDLGRCLIETGHDAGLFGLIDQRQSVAQDGLRLFHDCLTSLLGAGRGEALQRIIAATPRNSLLFVVALYISSMHACARDPERAIEEVKLASTAAQSCAAYFESDPALETLMLEGDMVETFETLTALESADRDAIFTSDGGLDSAACFACAPLALDAPFVFLSSCSEPYLDRFGEGLVKALDTVGARTVYHFHVVDPSPAVPKKIARLQTTVRNLDLRFSTETYRIRREGYSRASFYACSRLVRLPEVVAHYQRDVMIWDMDIAKVRGVDRLVAVMRGCDLGYFEMAHQRLSLICHLAAAYFANTPAARRCADLVARYAALKLRQTPYWLLDQTSLFCASRYLAATAGLRINDFSARPGGRFEDYVEVAGTAAEKQDMRKVARVA
jgi:hypothetical protein